MYVANSKPYIVDKWPLLLVSGEKVNKDQAAEIIIRTTKWPLISNNKEADEQFNNLIATPKEFKKGLSYVKPLGLNYLSNERITTCHINGTKGWIDWDGTIFANSWNIGKWPSVQDVTEEWTIVSEIFPFLNLKCQVLDQESFPTAEWIIKNGKVETKYPEKLLCELRSQYEDETLDLYACNKVGATLEDVAKGIELAKK